LHYLTLGMFCSSNIILKLGDFFLSNMWCILAVIAALFWNQALFLSITRHLFAVITVGFPLFSVRCTAEYVVSYAWCTVNFCSLIAACSRRLFLLTPPTSWQLRRCLWHRWLRLVTFLHFEPDYVSSSVTVTYCITLVMFFYSTQFDPGNRVKYCPIFCPLGKKEWLGIYAWVQPGRIKNKTTDTASEHQHTLPASVILIYRVRQKQ